MVEQLQSELRLDTILFYSPLTEQNKNLFVRKHDALKQLGHAFQHNEKNLLVYVDPFHVQKNCRVFQNSEKIFQEI